MCVCVCVCVCVLELICEDRALPVVETQRHETKPGTLMDLRGQYAIHQDASPQRRVVLVSLSTLILVFLPLDAYMSCGVRPSLRLYVCLSVTLVYCVKTTELIGRQLALICSVRILVH